MAYQSLHPEFRYDLAYRKRFLDLLTTRALTGNECGVHVGSHPALYGGLPAEALARTGRAMTGGFGMIVRRYYFRGSWPQFMSE